MKRKIAAIALSAAVLAGGGTAAGFKLAADHGPAQQTVTASVQGPQGDQGPQVLKAVPGTNGRVWRGGPVEITLDNPGYVAMPGGDQGEQVHGPTLPRVRHDGT